MNEPLPARSPAPTLAYLFLVFFSPTLGQFTPGPIVIAATVVGYLFRSPRPCCW